MKNILIFFLLAIAGSIYSGGNEVLTILIKQNYATERRDFTVDSATTFKSITKKLERTFGKNKVSLRLTHDYQSDIYQDVTGCTQYITESAGGFVPLLGEGGIQMRLKAIIYN